MGRAYRRKTGVTWRPNSTGRSEPFPGKPWILDGGVDAPLSARGRRRFAIGVGALAVLGIALVVLQRI